MENPEARLRNGCECIIADGGASWLQRVAHKHLLLVSVHILSCHSDNEQPEDNHDSEPQATDHGRVLVDSIQESFEQGPLCHGGLWFPAVCRTDKLPGVVQSALDLLGLCDILHYCEEDLSRPHHPIDLHYLVFLSFS